MGEGVVVSGAKPWVSVSISVGSLMVNGREVGAVSGFRYEGPPEGLGAALDLHRGVESQVRIVDDEATRNGRRLREHAGEDLSEGEAAVIRTARALQVGDRVRVLSGKHKDREGVVDKVVSLSGSAFVTLDRRPRERTVKRELLRADAVAKLTGGGSSDAES